ncbi:MAG: DUF3037 domain-containing protein [Solirubrobacterales bacterium]|nr:DUF3037 domain-containing protein [Solirubrobacterales bacterium]MCO5315691.1 DUF3037 domain-containing protein [Solirubrobacterales bacterium]
MGDAGKPFAFSYTVLQLVPSIQRDERINVGVALHSRQHEFIGIRAIIRAGQVNAIAPDFDLEPARHSLEAIVRIIEGDPAGGKLAELPAPERFGWLAAPSSTAIQATGTHTGMTRDPAAELERLFRRLVL